MVVTYKPVDHVIFDMDGLLINSEYYYTIAMQNVISQFGHDFTWDMKKKIMGRTTKIWSQMLVDQLSLPVSPTEFVQLVDDQYPMVFPLCKLMPGVEQLLNHLKSHGVPMAIASGAKTYSFELKTNHLGPSFHGKFHHILLASDDPEVKEGKPAPDSYLICRDRFKEPGLTSDRCLVFEDSIPGTIAGVRAGMQVITIPDPRMDIDEARRENPDFRPTLVLKSMEDFKPELFNLPPYQS